MKFLIVDDSPSIVQLVSTLLQSAGHTVSAHTSSTQALLAATNEPPDAIILDLMMPELDGFELCKRLRDNPALAETKIIVLSSKSYDFDRRRARQLGADGYLTKPIKPDTFLEQLSAVLAPTIKLTYWGVRGTLPVPGPESLRYGGNTPCVTIEAPGEPLLIFDAGTGIKKLSNALMKANSGRLTAKIFITHPHWDHINALPFFVPLYLPGNEIEILGATHGSVSTEQIISAQMDDVYFPITTREFGAHVMFRDLREEGLDIGGFRVDSMLLSHQGNCLGYRTTHAGRSICYITDNELFPRDSDFYNPEYEARLTQFVAGADILIADTTYLDSEYPSRMGWGHSCVSEVAALANRAGVKALHLFHHDPDQNDDIIERKFNETREALARLESTCVCVCPSEGDEFTL